MKITLGEQSWEVRPLTLGQLRKVLPMLLELGKVAEQPTLAIDVAIEVLCIALSRDDPSVTADMLLELECSFFDLIMATQQIARVSGLQPGEAEAVTKILGPVSMDPSPPPADTVTRPLMQ